MAYRYALDRSGTIRKRLIADIAAGERSQSEISREYGVSQQAVHAFSIRHAAEIEEMRDQVAAAITDQWVAVKGLRIESMRGDVERIDAILCPLDPDAPVPDTDQTARLLMAKRRHLRAIAEELGQIPKHLQITDDRGPATYQIVGVDLDRI